jgi:hypothetical protein
VTRPNRAPSASFETLEDRRLLSSSFFFFSSTPPDVLGAPPNELGLPSSALSLPWGPLGLPGPGSPAVVPPRDLTGAYKGGAQIVGIGGVRLRVNVDTQSGNAVTGSIRLPALGISISGTANVSFTENRRFSFTFSQQSNTVAVSGRVNRDRTISGTVELVTDGLRRYGNFAVTKL